MADKLKEQEREIGKMVKDMTDGITEELKMMLPHIDLSPEIPDDKIKKAILDVTPVGMDKLIRQFGRQRVMSFISEFTQGKEF